MRDTDLGDGQPRRSTHRPRRIRELIEQSTGLLLLRAALSAGLLLPRLHNPIEEAFAKIKNLLLLRKAAARSKEALW